MAGDPLHFGGEVVARQAHSAGVEFNFDGLLRQSFQQCGKFIVKVGEGSAASGIGGALIEDQARKN
jgi:hypothetical protein